MSSAETSISSDDLKRAVDTVKNGGVILYPTDTIWGIGCDATNPQAVARVFAIKQRSDSKAMISLVDSEESLRKWVAQIPEKARRLLKEEIRPLTIIYDSPRGIAKGLMAPDGSAAFRIPRATFVNELCRMAGVPLVSSSANIAGFSSPASFSEIQEDIISKVDYVCTFGRQPGNSLPSKILKISNDNEVSVIRE